MKLFKQPVFGCTFIHLLEILYLEFNVLSSNLSGCRTIVQALRIFVYSFLQTGLLPLNRMTIQYKITGDKTNENNRNYRFKQWYWKSNGQIFKTGYVIDEKYVILDFIGKGAFGEVYRAHQLNLQRDVAIKVVSQQWLESQEIDSDDIDTALQRFRREVQAMARVRHLNIRCPSAPSGMMTADPWEWARSLAAPMGTCDSLRERPGDYFEGGQWG